jgi:uncharacterized protein with FMN-binding domain
MGVIAQTQRPSTVRKTLFSIAFIAASGVYVAAADHLFDGHPTPGMDVAAALPPPGETPAPALASDPPAATLVPTPLLAPQPSAEPPPRIVAEAAPPPALPPLPRPRPTPPAAIRAAAATTTAAATGGYRDGTYTGTDEDAYYGRVQVQVTITGHHIAAVKVLDYPQDRRTSRYINGQALPVLKREALAATSASIDAVSGATLTSEAYIRSLGNALGQAGGGNA